MSRICKYLYDAVHAFALHQFRTGDLLPYYLLTTAEANIVQLVIFMNRMKEAAWR